MQKIKGVAQTNFFEEYKKIMLFGDLLHSTQVKFFSVGVKIHTKKFRGHTYT